MVAQIAQFETPSNEFMWQHLQLFKDSTVQVKPAIGEDLIITPKGSEIAYNLGKIWMIENAFLGDDRYFVLATGWPSTQRLLVAHRT